MKSVEFCAHDNVMMTLIAKVIILLAILVRQWAMSALSHVIVDDVNSYVIITH
jgi:hypothetical protein